MAGIFIERGLAKLPNPIERSNACNVIQFLVDILVLSWPRSPPAFTTHLLYELYWPMYQKEKGQIVVYDALH